MILFLRLYIFSVSLNVILASKGIILTLSTVGLVSISSFVYIMFQELLMAKCHFYTF